ncbi:hypothetical protein PVAG01_02032 [Phlyctema vagabunda]|uniref:Uncharacterized protein n=1 Tax=Phlyctema vagabunda TaxID=108571 RepID=A0ABR4PYU4_9HELO
MVANSRVSLGGYGWKDPTTDAYVAILGLAIIIIVSCIVSTRSFERTNAERRDRLRSKGYVVAAWFILFYLVLALIQTIVTESNAAVTRWWFIIYIISSLAWKVADILILAITLRIIHHERFLAREGKAATTRALSTFNAVTVYILAVVSLINFGLLVYQTTYAIRGTYTNYRDLYNVSLAIVDTRIAYQAIYLIASIFVIARSAYLITHQKSKASIILTAIIGPSFFATTLLGLVNLCLNLTASSSQRYSTLVDLQWAATFIYIFANIFIYVSIAAIGRTRVLVENEAVLPHKDETTEAESGLSYQNERMKRLSS